MSEPLAIFVEDDAEQTEIYTRVISSVGFSVISFNSITAALSYMKSTQEIIDLLVLDRRLPLEIGEPATDEFGDELLKQARVIFPDARLIIFTGYASISHIQLSLRGSGQLPDQDGDPIDRITVLRKDQSIEFKKEIVAFRQLIQKLQNIELIPGNKGCIFSDRDKRVLRRVAFEYRASSVTATPFSGGLTDADVWKCVLNGQQGQIATVVAKRVRKPPTPGGLPQLMPIANTTPTVATLAGLMGGSYVNVLSIAGSAPTELMELIKSHPEQAVNYARPIWSALERVPETRQIMTISDICKPLIPWKKLTDILAQYDISTPAETLTATVNIGMRHCDLHAANILVVEGHAVLIDFDSSEFASAAIDPIVMLLSTLVHPGSPLKGDDWPTTDEIDTGFGTDAFGRGNAGEIWFRSVTEWIDKRRTSDREFWSLVLAFAGRQLPFPDVLASPATMTRVLALARKAATAINAT